MEAPAGFSGTVVVIRHNGLGDLVTALPAMRGVRRAFPNHRLMMTCPSGLVPLAWALDMADSFITEPAEVHLDPSEHVALDDAMNTAVLEEDLAGAVVVLLRVPIRSDLFRGICRAGPHSIYAFRHEEIPETSAFPQFRFEEHILSRWARLLGSFGISTRNDDIYANFDVVLPSGFVGCTIVHVGAGSRARRWPVERWALLSRKLVAAGHRVLLTGSAAEWELAEQVRQRADLAPERNVCGSTDIMALAAIVRSARLVISTDTGIAHLATAARIPSVTLFGAVPPAWWGPPAGYPLNRSLWKGEFGDPYATTVDGGLLKITVNDVLAAVDDLEHAHFPQVIRRVASAEGMENHVTVDPRPQLSDDSKNDSESETRVFLGGPIQYLLTSDNSADVVGILRDIVFALKQAHCTVFSAHEVEDYGLLSDQFTPMSVAIRDYRWAEACDVYIGVLPVDPSGVPYRTDGTHIEIGWVTAMSKRVILLLDEATGQPYSHLVRGLVDLGRVVAVPLRQWQNHLIPLVLEAAHARQVANASRDELVEAV